MKKLRLAFAIDANKKFSEKNFSQAEYFQFYEYQVETSELKYLSEIENPILKLEEGLKYDNLIVFLKENSIDLLIARNYSNKLKTECEFFVPVIVGKSLTIEQILSLVKKHILWLIDELSLNKKENMVFHLSKGIYKYKIEN